MNRRLRYSLGLAVALGTSVLLLLGAGALGIIRDGGRPDLMYVAVLGVGLATAVAVRFRASGMALALALTAFGTLAVAVVALAAGLHDGSAGAAIDIVGISALYAALFTLSAWLFRQATDDRDAH
ncbi:hypothetical protein [Nocardioides sp. TF02-7]|uniref:hypothetical protein n=1 Tax=Nocardioides sp. TF02-7 TaxID=2917724 RepID=UPI001F0684DF|nr:hypothetical protein [Nocardioides sp. TF02-7]UMG91868.1 hypothetical protein MF408_17770 [Nocardioides sp. TF02-7]